VLEDADLDAAVDAAVFESFEPQVSITRVKSDEEPLRLANDTEYGLAAAVFSKDIARPLGLAKRIESGICHINGPKVHDEAQMPFGGVKASGYGRFGGRAAIDEFTELRGSPSRRRRGTIHFDSPGDHALQTKLFSSFGSPPA
jgi:acyl-CoA reductase-like NAD-dependent aldehyde dehydrogenase